MRVISNELKVIGSDGLDLLGVLCVLCPQERAQITQLMAMSLRLEGFSRWLHHRHSVLTWCCEWTALSHSQSRLEWSHAQSHARIVKGNQGTALDLPSDPIWAERLSQCVNTCSGESHDKSGGLDHQSVAAQQLMVSHSG